MKRISQSLRCVACLLLAFAAISSAAPKQEPPFTLSLQSPKEPLKAGQPVLLSVKITNTSDTSTTMPENNGVWGSGVIYQLHVSDQDGRPLIPRFPGKVSRGRTVVHAGSVQSQTLNPGESSTDLVNVTDDYDLSRPGDYKIWIAEPYGSGPNRGLVVSNAVTVTVK